MKSLLDPKFRYINAASHDAGSEQFRRRQRARQLLAQRTAKRGSANVQPITPRKVKAIP